MRPECLFKFLKFSDKLSREPLWPSVVNGLKDCRLVVDGTIWIIVILHEIIFLQLINQVSAIKHSKIHKQRGERNCCAHFPSLDELWEVCRVFPSGESVGMPCSLFKWKFKHVNKRFLFRLSKACDGTCRTFPNDQSSKARISFGLWGSETVEQFSKWNIAETGSKSSSVLFEISSVPIANENEIVHCVISVCFKNAVWTLFAVSRVRSLVCSTGFFQFNLSDAGFANFVSVPEDLQLLIRMCLAML